MTNYYFTSLLLHYYFNEVKCKYLFPITSLYYTFRYSKDSEVIIGTFGIYILVLVNLVGEVIREVQNGK